VAQSKKYLLTHTHTHTNTGPLSGMSYKFCFANFIVKCPVWQGDIFQPKEARLRLDFL